HHTPRAHRDPLPLHDALPICGDGHLQSYCYQREGRANGDQHRFRLAPADTAALDRAASFLSSFGIWTDRFLFQIETATRRRMEADRKSTRLNSSHQIISYAVF